MLISKQCNVPRGDAGFQTAAVESQERVIAELIYDSCQHTPPSNMRNGSVSARQLLYRSGSVCVDMRMEPRPGTDFLVLIGQLLDSSHPSYGMRCVPVSLRSDGDTISRQETNEVGEFDFGIGADSLHHAELVFGIGRQKLLVVPVPEAIPAPVAKTACG
jgi:hypothetical protein